NRLGVSGRSGSTPRHKRLAHGSADDRPLSADECHPTPEICVFGHLRDDAVCCLSCLAVWRIRSNDVDGHTRYMAGSVLFALEPALERIFVFYIPGVSGFAAALYFALIAMEVILGTLLFFEWRRGRIRLPFAMALGFFVAMHILMAPVATSAAFSEFANWFAKI